jgi:hypothetical protein
MVGGNQVRQRRRYKEVMPPAAPPLGCPPPARTRLRSRAREGKPPATSRAILAHPRASPSPPCLSRVSAEGHA